MEKEQRKETKNMPLWADGVSGYFDPLGSYTGLPEVATEEPVQDVDDL